LPSLLSETEYPLAGAPEFPDRTTSFVLGVDAFFHPAAGRLKMSAQSFGLTSELSRPTNAVAPAKSSATERPNP
jgi:hypothetical protein